MKGFTKALEKSIESGYRSDYWVKDPIGARWIYLHLMQPTFWFYLGKNMGWEKKLCTCDIDTESGECIYKGYEWRHQWHRFIEHIATGGGIDQFFEHLLP